MNGYADTTLYHNAQIITLDDSNPKADALVVKDGRIVFVGKSEHAPKKGVTRRIDLKQKWVFPGFIESHGHFLGLGLSRLQLSLESTQSEEQILERVQEALALHAAGEWITGRGWDQNDWPKQQFPTFEGLSNVAPDHPVVLTRIDGHALWCNRQAMQRAGITKATPDPMGGRILRDPKGHPTGIFIDNAMALISRHVQKPKLGQMKKAALLAQAEAFKFGVTSFHDAGVDQATLDLYQALYASGELKLRLYAMLDGSDSSLLQRYFAQGKQINLHNHRLNIRCIKLYLDGALGSRGAALLKPYNDAPDQNGLLLLPQNDFEHILHVADQHGFQIATHAIGDKANQKALDGYATLARPVDRRLRIEHAQILLPQDQLRFKQLNVIASMQPTHCTSDAPWVFARLGTQRAQVEAYAWRSLQQAQVTLSFGSDAPVESINPFNGLYAATTRQYQDDPIALFFPEQKLTLHEALKAFTVGGAFAEFAEHEKGQLAAGYLADFMVVDQNLLEIPPHQVRATKVLMTVVHGEPVLNNF